MLDIAGKFVAGFASRLQLARRLKLECRPLLLGLVAEVLDRFLDLGRKRISGSSFALELIHAAHWLLPAS
ncbi:MAG: hypothetical protein KGL35_29840 [Bradyrhizobium sp.]|uniref:hypothetical protein n=1 Tax=Bradyrhizobium sp. TaxID=376 RepID=UPI001C2954BF|nr:hypothetical protein [Bradyrhizobium sp.]MBU6461370.1 hypothetical protein [Pseudomonadota bacterium]MDE2066546.1 hypothetical protein [Bradyrhizobium sp.]MDE2472808.1 hypothetical protein [Bradyrhizobium sp.]